MEAAEIEKLIGDLELGVDRLRSLYEQYFMGIEKLEPTVPRKDVERRVQILRKEQIRNTAQRFRFQMVLQRYNTYQTHWQRVCREIENGTYKRHVMRAQRKFAEAPEAAPAPKPPDLASPGAATAVATPGRVAPALSPALAAELAELDRDFAPMEELDDADLELTDDAAGATKKPGTWRKAAAPPHPAAPPGPPRPPPAPARPGGPLPVAPAGPVAGTTARKPPPPPRAPTPPPPPPRPLPAAPGQAVPAPGPAPLARPPAPAPPRAPAPAPAPVPHVAPPPVAAARPDIPDDRVRQLYAQYVDTKRKQNESTAAITFEGVAKSLRESSARLREKHGKAVDFEVAVRDGKTILKPVIK